MQAHRLVLINTYMLAMLTIKFLTSSKVPAGRPPKERLVKTTLPVHYIVSQVLFCVEKRVDDSSQ